MTIQLLWVYYSFFISKLREKVVWFSNLPLVSFLAVKNHTLKLRNCSPCSFQNCIYTEKKKRLRSSWNKFLFAPLCSRLFPFYSANSAFKTSKPRWLRWIYIYIQYICKLKYVQGSFLIFILIKVYTFLCIAS